MLAHVNIRLASSDNYLAPFDVKMAFTFSYNNDNIKRKIIFEEEVIMSNKTALITGATGGLGKEFVRIHAEKGGNLVLVGRNPQKLEQL